MRTETLYEVTDIELAGSYTQKLVRHSDARLGTMYVSFDQSWPEEHENITLLAVTHDMPEAGSPIPPDSLIELSAERTDSDGRDAMVMVPLTMIQIGRFVNALGYELRRKES